MKQPPLGIRFRQHLPRHPPAAADYFRNPVDRNHRRRPNRHLRRPCRADRAGRRKGTGGEPQADQQRSELKHSGGLKEKYQSIKTIPIWKQPST